MPGVRDAGLLESAVVAPQNAYVYDENADVFDLAATYIFSIAKNHPFYDGNKRSAAEAASAFLRLNGLQLEMAPVEFAALVLAIVEDRCDLIFAAELMYLACFRNAQDLFEIEPPPHAPQSYVNATSDAERAAIVTDVVTSSVRARLLEVCGELNVRPARFDDVLDRTESELFNRVEAKWREQFGMK
jgi:death-on-curing protein